MKSRICKDWIRTYLNYTKDNEYPRAYHLWNAICCLSGAMQRRVYMPWEAEEPIFPNLYVVLVGHSGLGKGRSMKPALSIFKAVGLPVAPASITIEQLLVFMGRSIGDYIDNVTKKPVVHTSIQIFSEELSVLLGQKNIKKLSILTDLFDASPLWENATKTSGEDSLPNVCMNLLGASAPDWFPSMIPQEALGGGFTSRVIFVVERAKFQIMSRPAQGEHLTQIRESLIQDLRQIAAVTFNGPIEFNHEGWKAWDKYYIDQETNIRKDIWPVRDPIFRGYCLRRSLHIRKLSMVFAVSRGDFDWKIEPRDLQNAIGVLRNAEKKMPRLFHGVGINVYAHVTNSIREYLHMRGTVTRTEVLNNFASELDAQSLYLVERTLQDRGIIDIVNDNGTIKYVLIEKEEED
jgi:hypothetical protein